MIYATKAGLKTARRRKRPSLVPAIRKSKRMMPFLKDESGATSIEYGLIAAGISVAIIAVVNGLGTQLNVTFTKVKTALVSQ